MRLDAADACMLAELLRFLSDWLITDHDHFHASLQHFVGHPDYDPPQLHNDLHGFALLLAQDNEET